MEQTVNQQSKVWTREAVVALLLSSKAAVVRAIKQLHARQTADEQQTRTTKERNGRGFNANDAPFLSDIAKKLPRYNDNMTPRQLAKARRMLPKYARQLLEIIQENGGVVDFGKPRNSEIAVSPPSEPQDQVQFDREYPDTREPEPADVIAELWGRF